MKKMVLNIILAVSAAVFCFSGWKLYSYYKSYQQADNEYKKIRKEVTDKGHKEIDFKKLKKINSDVIGWIYIPGTEIDYPIVKGDDNEEYLHKTFDGTDNSSGSIFMDKNGKKDFQAEHNILYGHHMRNGSMFADLLEFREQSFVNKHHQIILYTPQKTLKLRVIAAYARKADTKIPVTFGDQRQKLSYLDEILRQSEIQTEVRSKKKIQKIYTFVTCSYESEDNRTFVHAIESGE